MSKKIFISYRRSEAQMVAGRLRESLAQRLGEKAIFRDKDSIRAGEDWTKAVEAALVTDEIVVLALNGPGWSTTCDEAGIRRLDDQTDWNRVELERALRRGARIIPLLIDETRMPKGSELPESLRQITNLSALRLRDDDWNSDIKRLSQAIGSLRGRGWAARPVLYLMAAVLIVGGGIGYWWLGLDGRSASSVQSKISAPSVPSKTDTVDDPIVDCFCSDGWLVRKVPRSQCHEGAPCK
jgi:TIR domain